MSTSTFQPTIKDLSAELLLLSSLSFLYRHGGEEFLRLIINVKTSVLKEQCSSTRELDTPVASLDEVFVTDGDELITLIEGNEKGPEQLAVESERTRLMNGIINTLNPRDRDVICRRFGLQGHAPETLEMISHDRGVTRERIRQLEKFALRKLRRKLVDLHLLREHL